jgi:predicted transcriptional regulator of viral defense system
MRQYRRTLSDRESKILSSLSYSGRNIFTIKDVQTFVGKPRSLLDGLVRKKWVLKVKKGVYIIVPFEAGELGAESYTVHSFVIASLLVKPYYIGYWSALNYHGLTDQTPPAVYIASTKPRNSRRILNAEFRFVKILALKMFGMEDAEIEERKVIVSSPEKTIIDCLDHPEHCGGVDEVAKALYFAKDEINPKKLVSFAKKIGNTAVLKRLGYLAEVLKLENCLKLLSAVKLGSGYSLLDPTLPKRGKIRERWKLVLNVPIDPQKWSV